MSVIGPRPLLVEYLPYYTKEEHHRHDVRPGFSDDKSNEDYFIPRILRVEQLNKLPREKKNRFFPELSSSIDIAIGWLLIIVAIVFYGAYVNWQGIQNAQKQELFLTTRIDNDTYIVSYNNYSLLKNHLFVYGREHNNIQL